MKSDRIPESQVHKEGSSEESDAYKVDNNTKSMELPITEYYDFLKVYQEVMESIRAGPCTN